MSASSFAPEIPQYATISDLLDAVATKNVCGEQCCGKEPGQVIVSIFLSKCEKTSRPSVLLAFITVKNERQGYGTGFMKNLVNECRARNWNLHVMGPFNNGSRKIAQRAGLSKSFCGDMTLDDEHITINCQKRT